MFAVVSTSLAHAQTKIPSTSSAGLRLDILGLRSDQGQVACSLFNDAKAFPRDGDKVYREVWVPIQADHAVCVFNDIPAGKYAAVVFHDENGDRKFNQNILGIPKEGYGFSNDAKIGFGPPTFEAAELDYDGQSLTTVIHLRYGIM